VLALLRAALDNLGELIDADPGLVNRRFAELDCGQTGGVPSCFKGERYCIVAANTVTLQRPLCCSTVEPGVNARATVDEAGVGGQTAIFHAVTQFEDEGLPITQLLVSAVRISHFG